MLKLSSAVDIPTISQLHGNESYTLQFNLEISKDHIAELLSRLNDFQTVQATIASATANTSIPDYNLESQITSILREVGIPAHIMGYRYLKDAIALSITDRERVNAITKTLYPEVASMNNTTSSRVERAIRHAIEVAWTRGNMDVLDEIFGYTVNPNSGRPTNSEFIALISDNLALQNQSARISPYTLH